jgi:urea transport system substrate-binding protein
VPSNKQTATGKSRRSVLASLGAAGAFGLAGCVGGGGGGGSGDDTLKAGALYALSGTIEVIGRPMMNSTELAINQINENGGIDGRQIELVKADNESDPQTGIEESRTLVTEENCDIVFGAYTSAMRNAITDVYVENEVPLFYPTLYEGGVCAPIQDAEGFSGQVNVPQERLEWVWFNGAVPRQQIQPYIPWLMEEEDVESFYLIGSDYVWPHTTNAVLDDFVRENGGEIIQENYVPLDFTDWGSTLSDIQSANPDAVYFTTVGASQVAMINQAADLGLTDEFVWAGNIMSEQEAQSAGEAADGIYTSAPYFTSLDTNENNDYISSYESEYGTDTTPNFVAEAAYWAPLMTAELLRQNDPQASTPSQVKTALENEATITAPQGEVAMDPGTHHCSLQSRVGQYNAGSGEFDVVEEFGSLEASGITVQGGCLTS